MSGGSRGIDFGGLSDPNSNLTRIVKEMDDERRGQQLRQVKSQEAMEYLGLVAKTSMAVEFCDRLNHWIKEFDEELDQDHEVGVKLVTFGQAVTFHVSSLGYHNPALIFFRGETEDGKKVKLIQHVTQISFILMAVPKPKPDEPKRPFGFAQGHEPLEEPQG